MIVLMDMLGWWLANGWAVVLIGLVGSPLLFYGYLTISSKNGSAQATTSRIKKLKAKETQL